MGSEFSKNDDPQQCVEQQYVEVKRKTCNDDFKQLKKNYLFRSSLFTRAAMAQEDLDFSSGNYHAIFAVLIF